MADGNVSFEMDWKVAKAMAGLESVIKKQVEMEQGIGKTTGAVKGQKAALAEFVAEHKRAHELGQAFQKQELLAYDARKMALIEEGKLDLKIAQDKRQQDEIKTRAFVANRDKERASWRRFLDEVKELNTTPLETFERRQEKLNTALRAGAIDQNLFNREVARMHAEMRPAGQAGGELIGKMTSLASTYLSVGVALQTIQAAMANVRKEASSSLELIKGREEVMGELFQVSEGKTSEEQSKDVDKMVRQSENAASRYGWDFNSTLKVRREARNAGADSSFDEIMKYSHLTRDPETVAKAVGQFKHNFGNEDLDFKTIANTALVASQGSPVNMKDIFSKLGESSVTAKNIGSNSDEFFAYYSALSKGYGNAGMAADRLSYLISKGQMEGLGGEGIGGVVSKINEMDPEERDQDIGKRKELNETLNILNDPATQKFVKEQKKAVQEAHRLARTPNSPLETRNRALQGSREMQGNISVSRAQAMEDISKRETGLDEAERVTQRKLAQSEMRLDGTPALIRGAAEYIGDWVSPYLPARMAGNVEYGGASFARGFGISAAAAASSPVLSPEAKKEQGEQLQILREIRDELRKRPSAAAPAAEHHQAARRAAQAQAAVPVQ